MYIVCHFYVKLENVTDFHVMMSPYFFGISLIKNWMHFL